MVWQVPAGYGEVRQGKVNYQAGLFQIGQGKARPGRVRCGLAGQGLARFGEARLIINQGGNHEI